METIEEGNKPRVFEKSDPLAGCRKPILGHLLLIAQTLYSMDTENEAIKTALNDSSVSPSNEQKQDKDGIFMRQTIGDGELYNKWEDFLINVFDPIMVKLADVQSSASDMDFMEEYLPQNQGIGELPGMIDIRNMAYDSRTFEVTDEDEDDEFDELDGSNQNTQADNNFADFASFDTFNNSNAPPSENTNSGAELNSFDPFATNSTNPFL